MSKNEERQQKILRIVVFSMIVIGAAGFLWFFAQGGELTGQDGIFGFFSDPTDGPTEPTP